MKHIKAHAAKMHADRLCRVTGGATGHSDVAADRALVRKMVKPEARIGRARGGAVGHSDEAADRAMIKQMVKPEARTGHAHGGKPHHGKKGTQVNVVVAPGGRNAPSAGMAGPVSPRLPAPPAPGLGALAGPPPMMPRASGGKVHHYHAGAITGEGRLEKTKAYGKF